MWKSLCVIAAAAALCSSSGAVAQSPKPRHAAAQKHWYAYRRSIACEVGAGTNADGSCVTRAQAASMRAAVQSATAATQSRINYNWSANYPPGSGAGTVRGKDIYVHDQGPHGVNSAPGGAASDIRLKFDIAEIGRLDNGIKIYKFRYIWTDQIFVGVIAQQVAAIVPEAVTMQPNGYLWVNYDRLGLKMQTWQQWQASHRRVAAAADSAAP